MSTITSSNGIFMLSAVGLYNVPVQIQGWAADDAFASEEVEFMEKYMGVDGKMSAGFTPYIVPLDFNLQADSASILIMDAHHRGGKSDPGKNPVECNDNPAEYRDGFCVLYRIPR